MTDDAQQLKDEIQKLEKRVEEHLDGWKRAKADYLNLKKDMEKEKSDIAKFATAAFLFELLPLADNFDRALAHVPEDQKGAEWVKGIFAMQKQLHDFLAKLGVTPVPTDGLFDPNLHEAVAHEPKEGAPPGTIIEVLASGYKLHGELLRPAKVKVAKEALNESKEEPQ